jgi:hypothetical protein
MICTILAPVLSAQLNFAPTGKPLVCLPAMPFIFDISFFDHPLLFFITNLF